MKVRRWKEDCYAFWLSMGSDECMTDSAASDESLNWVAVAALYSALLFGIIGLVYWGDYRNATWLALIGTGGGCTAYGRVLALEGKTESARWWNRGGALFYAIFAVWAGTVLLSKL